MTLKFYNPFSPFQDVLMMKSDLATLTTEIIFWNWNVKPAGVICRLDPKSKDNFYKGTSLNLVVQQFLVDRGSGGAVKSQEQIP